MCATCGCSEHGHDHEHAHDGRRGEPHAHSHLGARAEPHVHSDHAARATPHTHAHGGWPAEPHVHPHVHEGGQVATAETAILAKNDRIAERTRRTLREHGVTAINLVSSPGAGKTTLLERTIADLRATRDIQVVEGDQATSCDADRIRKAGAAAMQINTGTGCHLDAAMVERALRHLQPEPGSLVFLENVGNLVCPALFDLGERAKVLVASVTEGEDKPLKYPHMFRASQLVLLNKSDLLPHVRFDVDRFVRNAKQVNSALEVVMISALGGAGLHHWYTWIGSLDVQR